MTPILWWKRVRRSNVASERCLNAGDNSTPSDQSPVIPESDCPNGYARNGTMNQPTNMNSGMESDPMGGMFSQMFDRMQPMEPENTMPASEADTIRAEEESRRLNRQVAELRSENSTLSSRNQELQSTNRRLLSANQTLRKQLSEVNETARLLKETRKRERACIEREKRCDRILRREAVLEADESRVRDERECLKNERKRIREDIAEQVERESERMRRCLKESSDRQRERDRRILFALCLGVCSSMVPMLAVVMQGRWQTFADSLFDWLHMRGKQLTAVGQWLAGINARLNEIIPSGWWDRPLVFLLMLLLAAVVCGMPLLAAGGYVMVVFTTMRGWLTEGTLGVHIVLWTLAAMVGFVLAGHLAMIPHNPMGWPTWWILLTVAAHLIYLAKLAGPISRFIRNS